MNQEKINRVIALAQNLLGIPYVYGAPTDEPPRAVLAAFDCSGFIQHIFQQAAGVELPRSAVLQAGDSPGREIDSTNQTKWQAGDLLFMRGDRGHYRDELFAGRTIDIGHVMLYLGAGEIIHAKGGENGGVTREPLGARLGQINFVRRIFV